MKANGIESMEDLKQAEVIGKMTGINQEETMSDFLANAYCTQESGHRYLRLLAGLYLIHYISHKTGIPLEVLEEEFEKLEAIRQSRLDYLLEENLWQQGESEMLDEMLETWKERYPVPPGNQPSKSIDNNTEKL